MKERNVVGKGVGASERYGEVTVLSLVILEMECDIDIDLLDKV